jgi:hypothetical protein
MLCVTACMLTAIEECYRTLDEGNGNRRDSVQWCGRNQNIGNHRLITSYHAMATIPPVHYTSSPLIMLAFPSRLR